MKEIIPGKSQNTIDFWRRMLIGESVTPSLYYYCCHWGINHHSCSESRVWSNIWKTMRKLSQFLGFHEFRERSVMNSSPYQSNCTVKGLQWNKSFPRKRFTYFDDIIITFHTSSPAPPPVGIIHLNSITIWPKWLHCESSCAFCPAIWISFLLLPSRI